ncbi:MAG: hypothetical protein NUW06_07725 [Candidatus Acetothermia bacterium]|nr:hypothetical protein [Candidatus Acetothermia bacterium]MDH7505922.1 hypothetical protein [Candidatus Acetothermia bacterium]
MRTAQVLRSIRGWAALLLALALLIGVGYGQTQQAPVQAVVEISNQSCRGGVQIVQFTFLRDSTPFAIKIFAPAIGIAVGETKTFTFELTEKPTAVNIRGTISLQQALDVTAPVGTTQYTCGLIKLSIPGEEAATEGPQLPPQLSGIAPGITPQQALAQLQANGFTLAVQGSEAEPKISDASDPLIIGALGPAVLTGAGYWVSAPGQLRAAVLTDQPATNMVLLVISNALGFCFSITPLGGGVALFCDRPAAFAPATTFGGGPVPGTVFLVLILKIGGPTMPFVLSLSA